MEDMNVIVWLFPILFMFHDFEEILLMKAWINRNGAFLSGRFPRLYQRVGEHFSSITTASFAMGVAEEFLVISSVTLVSFLSKSYGLWTGLFTAFVIHLVIHIGQAILLRRYVPALITSILCLPACVFIFLRIISLYPLGTFVLYTLLGFTLMVGNLLLVHKGMALFDRWLARYEKS